MVQPAWEKLPERLREHVRAAQPEADLFEIRLRAGGRMQLTGRTESRLCGERIDRNQLKQMAAALMEFSLYAWEDELARGYFTTKQGFRVGVAGKYRRLGGELHLSEVFSLCIRLARDVPGCADSLMPHLQRSRACLILSPPGCGKTTILRDAARQLSESGRTVAILDERSEISAAWQGIPGMDTGERTDVVEGLGKPEGIPMIVRALSPQVLVTDELGGDKDAASVLDALRCGVQVVASAHARSLTDAGQRTSLAPLIGDGFDMAVALKYPPGSIDAIHVRESAGWRRVSET